MGEDRLLNRAFSPAGCFPHGHYFQVDVINTCPGCGEVAEGIPVNIANTLTKRAQWIFWSLCAEVWFAHGLPPVLCSLCSRCFVPLIIPAYLFYAQVVHQHLLHYFRMHILNTCWRLHSVYRPIPHAHWLTRKWQTNVREVPQISSLVAHASRAGSGGRSNTQTTTLIVWFHNHRARRPVENDCSGLRKPKNCEV